MTVSANVSSILQQIAALSADELAELRAQLENQATNGANVIQPQLQSDPKDEAAFKRHGKASRYSARAKPCLHHH